MPIDRPPRLSLHALTPQLRQAIFNWIDQNIPDGVVGLAHAYLEAEVHPNHQDALLELEDRYGLRHAELFESFLVRVTAAGRDHARHTSVARFVPVDALSQADLVRHASDHDVGSAFLQCLPEPELITALELHSAMFVRDVDIDLPGYLEKVFRTRGLPYASSIVGEITWVGDPETRERVIAPALDALCDPRLSAARDEFNKARRHLRRDERKDAGKAAGDSVETTLAVLLAAHGHPQPQTPGGSDRVQASPLFDQLKSTAVGVLNEDRDHALVMAPIKVRHTCGHGAGANPAAPDRALIEAGVSAAAVAITYLATKLPPAKDGGHSVTPTRPTVGP